MKKHLIALLACGLIALPAQAKTVADYRFEKYPAKVYTGKKAPLKLGDWTMFKTRLRQTHADEQIGFAGNYMVATWGCGAGCLSGAMIDKRTGKVYGLPIGEETPYDFGCSYEFENPLENERVLFYPSSRLFISRNCESEQIKDTNQYIENYTFLINVWDEKRKTFKPLKPIHKTVQVVYD